VVANTIGWVALEFDSHLALGGINQPNWHVLAGERNWVSQVGVVADDDSGVDHAGQHVDEQM